MNSNVKYRRCEICIETVNVYGNSNQQKTNEEKKKRGEGKACKATEKSLFGAKKKQRKKENYSRVIQT